MAQRAPLCLLLDSAWIELERKVTSSAADAVQPALVAWMMRFGCLTHADFNERGGRGGVGFVGQEEGAQVNFLEIRGASADTVRQVTIRRGGVSVFEMTSLSDRAGRLTTAGEFLQAMSISSGLHGLYVDVRQCLLTTSSLEVEVTVMVGRHFVAERVGIRASVQTATECSHP